MDSDVMHSDAALADETRAWELMRSIGFCTLVTHTQAELHGRPMSVIIDQDEGRISMLADKRASAGHEIADNTDVLLAFGNGGSKFVTVRGNAHVDDSRSAIEELWNTGAKAYWPDGPSDSNIVAIVVEPTKAEYWDGPSKPVTAIKLAVAAISGSRPSVGENKKVEM